MKSRTRHVLSIGLDLDTSVVAKSLWQRGGDSSLHANNQNLASENKFERVNKHVLL